MSWKLASFVALALWGSYAIFGNEAGKVHGEKVSMAFEAVAMLAVAILALATYGTGDFSRVTTKSFVFATVMGLMSAGGLYIQLYALRVAPQEIPIIIMVTGMFPVVTVLITGVLRLGNPLSFHQWLGVFLAAGGLALVNWQK